MESALEFGETNVSEPKPQIEDLRKLLEAGSRHTVVVEEAATGTILVSLSLGNVKFKGVLLDTSNQLGPVVLPNRSDAKPVESVYELNYDVADDLGSSSQLRSTYQIDSHSTSPSKSITSLLNRSPRSQRIRNNLFKPKLLLCSMCKSHYRYTEDSDRPTQIRSSKGDQGDSRHSSHKKSKNKLKKSHKRKQKKSKLKKLHIRLTEIQTSEAPPSDNSPATSDIMDPYMFTGAQSPETDKPLTSSNPIAETEPNETSTTPKRRAPTSRKKTPAKKLKTTPKKEPATAAIESDEDLEQVEKAPLEGGKTFVIGDVVWGKIMGFPWWPGRIAILFKRNNSEFDAEVDWYNSNTKSQMNCNQLSLFFDDFERRFDRKKKTKSYQKAIEEAKSAAIVNAQLSTMDTSSDEEITPHIPQSSVTKHSAGEDKPLSVHEASSTINQHSPLLSNDMFVRENNSESPENKSTARRSGLDFYGDSLSPPILHTADLLEDPDSNSPHKRTTSSGSKDVTSTQPLL